MKHRVEPEGLHFYDRKNGLHFLLDEIKTKSIDYSLAPRTLSIAITDDCNCECSFCHIQKSTNYLSKEYILEVCKILDELGTLDIAIGGGEPLLHPYLTDICRDIWKNTKLGISITTNGQLINESLVELLTNNISFMRISLDSLDASRYHKIRKYKLQDLINKLLLLKGKIPFGINMVVTRETIHELDNMISFVKEIGADELLLLPIIHKGEIILNPAEMKNLEDWILKEYETFPIRILEQARKIINIPTLFDKDSYYNDYLYLSADKKMKRSSYSLSGTDVSKENIITFLNEWRKANN